MYIAFRFSSESVREYFIETGHMESASEWQYSYFDAKIASREARAAWWDLNEDTDPEDGCEPARIYSEPVDAVAYWAVRDDGAQALVEFWNKLLTA